MEEEREEEEVREKASGKRSPLPLRIITVSLRIPVILIIVLLIISFFGTSLFLSRYPNVLSFIGITLNPQLQLQQDNLKLMDNIGKLMTLPSDEQPTIATVTDVSAVAGQPFFANAQNGDKVLIYTNARKAILYRPVENRIIEVGAVNINQQNQAEITEEEVMEEEPEEETEELTPTPTPEEEPAPEIEEETSE